MNEFHECIIPHIQTVVPQTIEQVSLWGPATSWSVVYRLDLEDGTHLFARGTPRQRNDALVTHHLHLLNPTGVPRVLSTDLLPTASWRWFLLEDIGGTPAKALTLPQAVEVAQALGQFQRTTERDVVLPFLLADCSANNLHAQALSLCHWALSEQDRSWQEEVWPLVRSLKQVSSEFADLTGVLAEVPATIIHSDLCAANLALTAHGVSFFDWEYALWGIGGISLVNLILSQPNLERAEASLWDAYQQGCGLSLSQAYQRACSMALEIIDLVVCREGALCRGRSPAGLIGLLPALRSMVSWVHGPHMTDTSDNGF